MPPLLKTMKLHKATEIGELHPSAVADIGVDLINALVGLRQDKNNRNRVQPWRRAIPIAMLRNEWTEEQGSRRPIIYLSFIQQHDNRMQGHYKGIPPRIHHLKETIRGYWGRI